MAKINARELDPQRYSCIQTEQQELKKQYSSHITMARICPYCQNKLPQQPDQQLIDILGGLAACYQLVPKGQQGLYQQPSFAGAEC